MIRLILATDFNHIETYTSCENLFEDIERMHPDMILMDLRMPYFNCQLAITSIRENDKTHDIPVIIFSKSGSNLIGRTKRMKGTAMIEKPFNINDLREIVRNNIA